MVHQCSGQGAWRRSCCITHKHVQMHIHPHTKLKIERQCEYMKKQVAEPHQSKGAWHNDKNAILINIYVPECVKQSPCPRH